MRPLNHRHKTVYTRLLTRHFTLLNISKYANWKRIYRCIYTFVHSVQILPTTPPALPLNQYALRSHASARTPSHKHFPTIMYMCGWKCIYAFITFPFFASFVDIHIYIQTHTNAYENTNSLRHEGFTAPLCLCADLHIREDDAGYFVRITHTKRVPWTHLFGKVACFMSEWWVCVVFYVCVLASRMWEWWITSFAQVSKVMLRECPDFGFNHQTVCLVKRKKLMVILVNRKVMFPGMLTKFLWYSYHIFCIKLVYLQHTIYTQNVC